MTDLKPQENMLCTRQICFFFAFLLPTTKLLSVPALLATYAQSDLLLPALAHFLLQGMLIFIFIILCSKIKKNIFDLLSEKISLWFARIVYIILAIFYIFYSLYPLLNLERFVYAAFFDSEPSISTFLPFFILSAYIAAKDLRSFGRCCDIALPIFILSYSGLMLMSVGEADFTNLMPLFSVPIKNSIQAFTHSFSHFSEAALLLPLIGEFNFKKGDGKKILFSYIVGAIFILFFLAVFYGIFFYLAPRQTFAFDKTAQYFSALEVVGRIDFLFVYLMTILLLFCVCFPLQLSVHCFSKGTTIKNRLVISSILNLGLLTYTLIFNKKYNSVRNAFSGKLSFIFPLFATLPLLFSLLLLISKKKERKLYA